MEGTEEDWWEILTDYMKDTDTEHSQGTSEAPNLNQRSDGQPQAHSLEATGDATERSPAGTTEGQSADTQASDTDQTGVGTQLHKAGQEESKDELQLPRIGVKRRRSRRTQIEDLLAGAALPVGKRIRTAVDYTPSLDKEDTKVAAKEIRTLPGLRHQRWPVGYARSTINKVLAPGQDAGFGLFATSPIECNAIICTYEGASVDYDAAVADRYRSHYLMTCPTTKRAIDAADFNSCYGRFACDPLDKALYNAICWSHTIPMVLRAIAPIRTCYEIFWFYGDSFPWPSELLILRARFHGPRSS